MFVSKEDTDKTLYKTRCFSCSDTKAAPVLNDQVSSGVGVG